MREPIQQPDAAVMYAGHRRQTEWINQHDWKHEMPARRSLRTAVATTLLALARRIAPPTPEMERSLDALVQ